MMFSKIDRKILIWLVVALVIVVLLGITAYKRFAENAVEIQNLAGGDSIENTPGENDNNIESIDVNLGSVEAEGGDGSGKLIICQDKCGDGVCQEFDAACSDNFNCPCAETLEECPQDCK